jgi:hypothetical protein
VAERVDVRGARSVSGGVGDALHEPRGDGRRDDAEQSDAGEHQADGDDPTLSGDRKPIAISDGGDRGAGPPEGVAARLIFDPGRPRSASSIAIADT